MKQITNSIEIERMHGAAVLWMNRAEKHNALNPEMMEEFLSAMEELYSDPHLRVLVLRGKGASFCAGADIDWMKQAVDQDEETLLRESGLLVECFRTIYQFPKPVVAVVHGNVIGGGMGLMAAADLVLAQEGTRFSLREVRLGLIPATILPYLLKRCSPNHINELAVTGETIGASQALEMQLVNYVTVQEALEEELELLITRISKGAPGAIQEVRELIREISGKEIDQELMEETVSRIANRRKEPEAQEGMRAFLSKRNPNWITNAGK